MLFITQSFSSSRDRQLYSLYQLLFFPIGRSAIRGKRGGDLKAAYPFCFFHDELEVYKGNSSITPEE